MRKFRNLRPHISLQSIDSKSLSKRKLTLTIQGKKKKLSSAVQYKNQFKEALLCKYEQNQNEQEIETLLEGQLSAPKQKNTSQFTIFKTLVDFQGKVTQLCYPDSMKRFRNTLWSPTSPVNKLEYL